MSALADLLPRVASLEQYSRVYADSRVWAPAVNEIAVRHGLPTPGTRQTLGSHIVYKFGDSIVKLYFPMWFEDFSMRLVRAERHHNAPEPWRSWIRQQLEGFREPDLDHVLLNCDLTEDHVLLSEEGGRWRVTGLIDFGDARIGHPYYDFVAPLCHYTYGDPRLSTQLLRAYGLPPTRDVTASLTRYCLLHEFGRLRDFLDRHPAANPQAFVEALWGVEQSALG